MKKNNSKKADFVLAHCFSSMHSKSIRKSKRCGCFYCLEVFDPIEIQDWCNEDDTALCPKCGIDSVIGNTDINFDNELLKNMQKYWFGLPTNHCGRFFEKFQSKILKFFLFISISLIAVFFILITIN